MSDDVRAAFDKWGRDRECYLALEDDGSYVDPFVNQAWDAYRAGIVAGMRRAAEIAEQSWRDGYRGEVNSGFAILLRSAATKLEQEQR